jgi:hypothetical protein
MNRSSLMAFGLEALLGLDLQTTIVVSIDFCCKQKCVELEL